LAVLLSSSESLHIANNRLWCYNYISISL